MAIRNFFALNSSNLVVRSSSNAAIVDNPIINNSDTPNGTVFEYSSGGGTTVFIDDTGGNTNVFEDDNTAGHVITDGGGIVADGTGVEAESRIELRALDINGDPTGPTITITVFSRNGDFSDVWGFSTDTALQDGVSYIKTGGSNTGSSGYNGFITCFGAETQIDTATGPRKIEQITPGDLVWTRDNDFKPVRWVGTAEVAAHGAFAPVVIAAGALGNTHALTVSQEHRMLVSGFDIELLFGEDEALVAAKHLCGIPGVRLRHGGRVRYVHLMFDQHEIIRANGLLSESFFVSPLSIRGIENNQRQELLRLFPSLGEPLADFGSTAARTLKSHEARVVIHRMLNNYMGYCPV